MEPSMRVKGGFSGGLRALRVILGIALVLAATATARAQEDEIVRFRWREPVRCGPDGTLRFDSGARLDLIDPFEGFFEFRGEAREESNRREEYAITLTFLDWDDRVLFEIASEPFEMDSDRRTDFLVFGRERRIADSWDEIAAVELDTQVPFEPLFEDAFDFYGGVLRYRREQDLEGRIFR
jgi:hypothetical protein